MLPTRTQALTMCAFVVATALVSAGLLALAVLAPVTPAALVPVVLICVALPVAAGCELPAAIRTVRRLRMTTADRRALQALRRQLAALPEIAHPLER